MSSDCDWGVHDRCLETRIEGEGENLILRGSEKTSEISKFISIRIKKGEDQGKENVTLKN